MTTLHAARLQVLIKERYCDLQSQQIHKFACDAAKAGDVAVFRFVLFAHKQCATDVWAVLQVSPPNNDAVFRAIEFTDPSSRVLQECNRVTVLRRVNPSVIDMHLWESMLQMLWFMYAMNLSTVCNLVEPSRYYRRIVSDNTKRATWLFWKSRTYFEEHDTA